MSDSKGVKKAILAGVLAIGIVIAGSCSKKPEEQSSTPAKSVDTLFVVEVDNLEFTLSQVDQYLTGISPIPLGMSMLVRMKLAGILDDPQLTGLDMGGKFRVIGVLLPDDSEKTEPASRVLIAGWLPVSDYAKLVEQNPKFSKPDANGISELAVSLGMPGMPTNPDAAPSGPTMVITKLDDGYAMISSKSEYDKVVQYKKLFAAAKTTKAEEFAPIVSQSDYPIRIYGDVQAASKAFGPILMEKINEAKGAFSQISAAQGPASAMMGDPNMISGVMDMYISLLETAMKEVSSFTIAIKPTSDVLLINETITAVPGTDLAKMLVADPSADKENKLMGYLEDGAAMNFAFKMNKPFWRKMTLKSMDLLATMAGQSVSTDDMTEMKELMADSMDAMGGALAGAFKVNAEGKSLFEMKYVIEIDDADKFNKLIDKSVELFESTGILGIYKGLGMDMDYTMKRNVETYKGVSIDSAKLVMKSTEPNSPQGQMINAMYAEGFEYRWGIVDGLCTIAIGGEVDSAVHELIDLAKAGGPEENCSEVQAGLKMLPDADKADFFATYNYVRLLKMVGVMMKGMTGGIGGTGITMPEIDIPTKSNLNIAGKIADGGLTVDIAIPKQHVSELMAAFMMFAQQMQPQQPAPGANSEAPTTEKSQQQTSQTPATNQGDPPQDH